MIIYLVCNVFSIISSFESNNVIRWWDGWSDRSSWHCALVIHSHCIKGLFILLFSIPLSACWILRIFLFIYIFNSCTHTAFICWLLSRLICDGVPFTGLLQICYVLNENAILNSLAKLYLWNASCFAKSFVCSLSRARDFCVHCLGWFISNAYCTF